VYLSTKNVFQYLGGNNGVFEVELNVPDIGDAAKYLIGQ
jgi:hypothetical protein